METIKSEQKSLSMNIVVKLFVLRDSEFTTMFEASMKKLESLQHSTIKKTLVKTESIKTLPRNLNTHRIRGAK
jgi:hypothetical protein